jgi:NAD+ synthase (glutamine-hydrolysing)
MLDLTSAPPPCRHTAWSRSPHRVSTLARSDGNPIGDALDMFSHDFSLQICVPPCRSCRVATDGERLLVARTSHGGRVRGLPAQAPHSMRVAVLATCNLNQWAMDFDGNLSRIRESLVRARAAGARFRVGPELEVTGYGCEDHFFELDTFTHAWESIAELLRSDVDTADMLVDVGAPVTHRGVPYNCRVLLLNREVVLVRPKMCLAGEGNYREPRWFRAWPRDRAVEDLVLPSIVRAATRSGRPTAPVGPAILQCDDGSTVACESCEELWTPDAPHVAYALAGVDVIANGSASHHELRKLGDRVRLLGSATRKGGGVYLYANQIGCDGGRLYYDGSALVAMNGDVLAQGSQFSLGRDVEVVTARVDLDDVVSYRMAVSSRGVQAAAAPAAGRAATNPLLHRVPLPPGFSIVSPPPAALGMDTTLSPPAVQCWAPEREISLGPACWLWDYLRRSGMNGFFLPLSGGADSSSTAAIVGSMCQLLVEGVKGGDKNPDAKALLADVRRVTRTADTGYVPVDSCELASRLLHTAYMGSGAQSSAATRRRAAALAQEVGAWHCALDIGAIVDAALQVLVSVFGEARRPRFRAHGGSNAENLALQNIQARSRMLLSYLFAQLTLWARGQAGSLLVLGSANVDEGLRGYLTKYDCSAADLNPIGGICKADLKAFLRWAAKDRPDGLGYASLQQVVDAPPTAELEPITSDHAQTDEEDMGMTYDELTWYGKLRKLHRCGPLSMYRKLVSLWSERGLAPADVAAKVKFFFRMYAVNRHKMTTLTPSYHAENYSPEDNRFDLRQFLYNTRWTRQFRAIDVDVEQRGRRPS